MTQTTLEHPAKTEPSPPFPGLIAVFARWSNQFDQLLARDRVWGGAVVAVLVLQLTLIFTHRPCRDEWQSLQLALQSPTLIQLFDNLHYEGHPPLWYMILRATAAVVPIYWVLPSVAAVLAVITQLAILLRAPFIRADRFLLSTGTFVLFEDFVVSRGMTLGVTCIILAMVLRQSRWKWLFLMIMPLCDFLFGVFSVLLIGCVWRDKRLWWPGLMGYAICGLIAAKSVMPAHDMVQAIPLQGFAHDLSNYGHFLSTLLIPFQTVGGNVQWNGEAPLNLAAIAGPIFVWFAYRETRANPFYLLLFMSFLLLTLVFSVAVYPLHIRHLTLIALLLVCIKWREVEDGMAVSAPFHAWLAVGSVCGLSVAALSFAVPFDTDAAAAQYIVDHKLTDKRWIAFPEYTAQGVMARTGMEFERPYDGCTHSFNRWNYRMAIKDAPHLATFLRGYIQQHGRSYLLSNRAMRFPSALLKPLAYVPAGYDGEKYFLYVVGADKPQRATRAPRCAPDRVPLTSQYRLR